MQVSVQGFVDNMPEWMSACDVIVTKAGPGTIAEALICGLPIILNGFVPCQVCFVAPSGVSQVSKSWNQCRVCMLPWTLGYTIR